MTNAGGFVTHAATFEPYGGNLEETGTGSSLGFTGEMHDSTGLVYLRARYADPVTGTFLTRDPVIGQIGGMSIRWNPYTYAGANPVNYIDPDGRFFWFGLAIAAALAIGTIGSAVHEANTQANDKGWDCVDWTKVASAAAAGFLGTALGLADLFPPIAAWHLLGMLAGYSPEKLDREVFERFFGLGEEYDSWSSNPYFQFGRGVGSLTSLAVGLVQLWKATKYFNLRNLLSGGGGGSGGSGGVSGGGEAALTWVQQLTVGTVAVDRLAYAGVRAAAGGLGILQMSGMPPLKKLPVPRPHRNTEVDKVIKSINELVQKGKTNINITVKSRAIAEEILEKALKPQTAPDGSPYADTTGMGWGTAEETFGRRSGFYHWDETVNPEGNYLEGHKGVTADHARYRHLQIETWDGAKVRLMWGDQLNPPPSN